MLIEVFAKYVAILLVVIVLGFSVTLVGPALFKFFQLIVSNIVLESFQNH